MTLDEYLGQGEWYFSESQQAQVPLASMNFQRAFYSHCKLLREFGDEYIGTVLSNAFVLRLCPTPDQLRSDLRQYGKVCYMYVVDDKPARQALYRAFKKGPRVSTHKKEWKDGCGWIEAWVAEVPNIRVKAH